MTIGERTCACNGREIKNKYTNEEWDSREEERRHSLARYERRQICIKDLYNYVDGNSPISYPASGLYVRPLRAIVIKGLRIEWYYFQEDYTDVEQKVQFSAEKGIFTLLATYNHVHVNGKGTKHMTIKAATIPLLNLQLRQIVYHNTEFDTNVFDKVCLRYLEFHATIPIHIQHRQVPWLYRKGKGTFQERVTVVVKTFSRYHKVRYLIDSINKFYPGTKIILADDTPNNTMVTFLDENVIHYMMPAFTGYFAGRNLGLSQVSTEYFLYMDDDQYFTTGTKLEILVSLLDKTDYHLVSGSFKGGKHQVYTLRVLGNDTYSCFEKKPEHYQEIKNFPGCYATDHAPNFFLASTNEVKAVGFDPHPALSRVGHYAFFLSSLGRLRIAVCTSVEFGHNNSRSKEDSYYGMFRKPGQKYYEMRRTRKTGRPQLSWKRGVRKDLTAANTSWHEDRRSKLKLPTSLPPNAVVAPTASRLRENFAAASFLTGR
ncbi:PREDICTED: beta-1,4 N-acetylgalactosaminyltransferase 2-like [Branchiostoma belcheri]|uniref:Beta-1,4 N-acetylgalactosaminyltransferase 2-like n=1 Tax=Branchiostoma belcheri TaxID=7741 RepID=A0A6P4ZKQ5_BRABE|nr:PREDICTED: beta-1,4 N-acetylgalactosaminyltransferase 2-like [Branchiostoma belcheri]